MTVAPRLRGFAPSTCDGALPVSRPRAAITGCDNPWAGPVGDVRSQYAARTRRPEQTRSAAGGHGAAGVAPLGTVLRRRHAVGEGFAMARVLTERHTPETAWRTWTVGGWSLWRARSVAWTDGDGVDHTIPDGRVPTRAPGRLDHPVRRDAPVAVRVGPPGPSPGSTIGAPTWTTCATHRPTATAAQQF